MLGDSIRAVILFIYTNVRSNNANQGLKSLMCYECRHCEGVVPEAIQSAKFGLLRKLAMTGIASNP